MTRARLVHAYFRAMRRLFQTPSPKRCAELHRLAQRLASRIAGRDRLDLFGGAR